MLGISDSELYWWVLKGRNTIVMMLADLNIHVRTLFMYCTLQYMNVSDTQICKHHHYNVSSCSGLIGTAHSQKSLARLITFKYSTCLKEKILVPPPGLVTQDLSITCQVLLLTELWRPHDFHPTNPLSMFKLETREPCQGAQTVTRTVSVAQRPAAMAHARIFWIYCQDCIRTSK